MHVGPRRDVPERRRRREAVIGVFVGEGQARAMSAADGTVHAGAEHPARRFEAPAAAEIRAALKPWRDGRGGLPSRLGRPVRRLRERGPSAAQHEQGRSRNERSVVLMSCVLRLNTGVPRSRCARRLRSVNLTNCAAWMGRRAGASTPDQPHCPDCMHRASGPLSSLERGHRVTRRMRREPLDDGLHL